jgi:transcription termination factor Rho
MARSDLAGQHLADLHALAAELEVPRYRLLRRDQLIAEIEARRGGPGFAEEVAPSEVEPEQEEPAEETEVEPGEEETETVTGSLEITRRRYGFLRLEGPDPGPDDVYVSASQIRRCELKPGDEVTGPARAPRRGERHRALVHVDLVNGEKPPDRDGADEGNE